MRKSIFSGQTWAKSLAGPTTLAAMLTASVAITAVNIAGGQLQINQAPGTLYESPTAMGVGTSLSVTGSGDLEITLVVGPFVAEVKLPPNNPVAVYVFALPDAD